MSAGQAAESPALEGALSLLEKRLHPLAVLLFGSRATGRERSTSDFDLAILLGGPVPDPMALAEIRTDLEDVLGHDVNLVALDEASPIIRMEALRAHRLLRCRDPELFERFVVRTLGEYFDLKRVREPIERALLSRGDR